MAEFAAVAHATEESLLKQTGATAAPADPRAALQEFIHSKTVSDQTVPALAALAGDISAQVASYGTLDKVPAAAVQNVRNDMYLSSEAIRLPQESGAVTFDADHQQEPRRLPASSSMPRPSSFRPG